MRSWSLVCQMITEVGRTDIYDTLGKDSYRRIGIIWIPQSVSGSLTTPRWVYHHGRSFHRLLSVSSCPVPVFGRSRVPSPFSSPLSCGGRISDAKACESLL